MKKNLIFIGMPAVGKSTVGIVVAKRLGMRFIDTDLLIQEQEGKLLREIIADTSPACVSIIGSAVMEPPPFSSLRRLERSSSLEWR